ncbi:hypothetical protein [Alcanivorax sp.]|uniref:hypothetical protein n=1 Tax=Alcanivorax sp. TaxID=1872427 RepID=UPI0025BD60AA|nr:hypothetical protein [Alcanivorax sp.]
MANSPLAEKGPAGATATSADAVKESDNNTMGKSTALLRAMTVLIIVIIPVSVLVLSGVFLMISPYPYCHGNSTAANYSTADLRRAATVYRSPKSE